jgi:hypothetical protein
MVSSVIEFKSLDAFREYMKREVLVPKLISASGRMSIVGAYNKRGELLAKVAAYSPKGA